MKSYLFTMFLSGFMTFSGVGQDNLKSYLLNFMNDTGQNPNGLESFYNADYEKAYKGFQDIDSNALINYQDFLFSSLLYQRDSLKLRDEVDKQNIELDEFQDYFVDQNQMQIRLEGSTTVNLDKNILIGMVGNDTVRILFDTGGDGVSISGRLVEKYKMVRDTSIKRAGYVPAYNYRSVSSPTVIPSLMIGDMEMINVPAKFKKEDQSQKRRTIDGPEFDIVMGMNMFVGFINGIEFNWEDEQLTFSNIDINLADPVKYIMFDAKPICLFNIGNQYYVALLDTGSPVDLIPKDIYRNNFVKKEAKQYGDFQYTNYTVNASLGKVDFPLVVADYLDDLNLTLNEERIEFIIGNNKKYLKFDLTSNTFELR